MLRNSLASEFLMADANAIDCYGVALRFLIVFNSIKPIQISALAFSNRNSAHGGEFLG
jgi:hypothetical protein